MAPILEATDISKKYRIHHLSGGYLSLRERITNNWRMEKTEVEDFWALDRVSFEVQAGESIGIIGPNGAGKSTLLKVLSRITPPSSGRIRIRGRIASLLEVGTGFHPELTGRENIFFNGSLLGMKRKEIRNKFDQIVDFSGTSKFMDTPLKHYSSGMQLRLAFSVSAFLDAEILVIDEVLAVGDVEFQKKCIGKMEEVTHQGRTILFVSHNMAAIKNLCSRGMFLKGGKLEYAGNMEEVISLYLNLEKVKEAHGNQGIPLANGVSLKEFHLSGERIESMKDLEYTMTLNSSSVNRITDLALLVFNELNERVGIVDLRHEDLWTTSAKKKEVTITGKIARLSLIEGNYTIGIFISSALCQGDYLNLKRLEVLPHESPFVPYAVKHRGYVEFDSYFKIS